MNINMFPTKGNLIAAKNSLALARQGYDLMDKKRNILVREMMDLVDQASTIQTEIDMTFRAAYWRRCSRPISRWVFIWCRTPRRQFQWKIL